MKFPTFRFYWLKHLPGELNTLMFTLSVIYATSGMYLFAFQIAVGEVTLQGTAAAEAVLVTVLKIRITLVTLLDLELLHLSSTKKLGDLSSLFLLI